MMNAIWALMGLTGILWGLATGRGAALTEGVLSAAIGAVQLCLRLAGGFALWSGMMAILERSGAVEALTRRLRPLFARLFPGVGSEARHAIAMNLTAKRTACGISQSQLARALRTHRQTVWRLEHAQMEPKPDQLVAIADTLKCSVDELVRPAQRSA